MKILFLTDNFPPEVNAPATRTYEHCLEWTRAGAEVTVITCFPNFPQGKVYPGYRNRRISWETIEGMRVIRVWSYMTANEGFLRRTLDYMSFMVSAVLAGLTVKTDVIIATSPQFFTAVAGSILSILKRRPWVMEVRDLWPDSIVGVGAMKPNRVTGLLGRLEKRLYRHTRLIIPVTDTFKRRIMEKGIPGEKIHVIKNGADHGRLKPMEPDPAIINRLGLQGKTVISYIGTHGMAHGLGFIVACAGELADDNVVFLFIGDGAKKEELKNQVATAGLKNVILLDPVRKEEVPAYLSVSHMALVPLKKAEIFTTVIPSKIFESAAMGIPVLLGVEGEVKEMVESFGSGLCFEPENREDFLAKARTLQSNQNIRENCRQGGLRLAAAYDRRRLARELLGIIEKKIVS